MKVTAFSLMTILLMFWSPSSSFAQNDVKSLLGDLTNYLFVVGDGSNGAAWQGSTPGYVGDVAVDGILADERTSGTVPYAGTIYTNDTTLDAWQDIVDDNPGQAFGSTGNTTLLTDLRAQLNSSFTQINALTVTPGYESRSSTSLDGLNTQNGIAETFVINVTSDFSINSTISITGDVDDLFILRWDDDANFSNGYDGQVKFSGGGAIVPLGDLCAANFIHVAGDINSSGGGSAPTANSYPQGPRLDDGQGALITGGSDFDGGGFFTGYWLTTGKPNNDPPISPWNLPNGKTSDLSKGVFVGGWYTITDQFKMTSGSGGVYVAPKEIVNTDLTLGFCYRTLSSPIEQSYQDFFAAFETNDTNYGGLWTQGSGIIGARESFGSPNVFTLNSDGSDWEPVPDLTQTLRAGTGVLISVFEEDVFGSSDPNTSGFPKSATFLGSEEPFGYNLGSRPGTTNTAGDGSVTDNSFQGYSILGNPFSEAIDFGIFYNSASGIEQAAWVYDINNDNRNNPGWRSTNGSGIGDITGGIIAAGQGFLVENTTTPGTPSVSFQDDAKVSDTGTFYGKKAAKPDHLRMEVRGEDVYNSAWVQFSEKGTTTEKTRGDVVQFYPFKSDYAVLSTVKQGMKMDIGHFPYPDEEVEIPLIIETTSVKPLTLKITDLQIATERSLYLYDRVTGESTELAVDAEYTFVQNGTSAKATSGCLRTPTGLTGPAGVNKEASPRFMIISNNRVADGESSLPSEFSLSQNYPNPFNPTTQITYQLPRQSDVRLQVFDMAGRQVATLVSQSVSTGTHTVNFDASDLSSGVYMYRLQAGSIIITKKLTLIK